MDVRLVANAQGLMNPPTIVFIGPSNGWQAAHSALGSRANLVHVESTQEAVAQALKSAQGIVDASIRVPLSDAMIADD